MEILLKNPKIWLALVGLAAAIISEFIPGFSINREAVASSIVVLVAYLYGVIRDPGSNAWASLLCSRKFWSAAIGVLALWLTAFKVYPPFGFTYDQITELVTAVSSALIISFAHASAIPNQVNGASPAEVETDPLERVDPPSAG